mmetsp:Transcript_19848/g.26376  ORF Transcript_19848/g.26376 Transcript_19848/m.26376 type:complete len:159 (+) Transcript_19848:20-496(+)
MLHFSMLLCIMTALLLHPIPLSKRNIDNNKCRPSDCWQKAAAISIYHASKFILQLNRARKASPRVKSARRTRCPYAPLVVSTLRSSTVLVPLNPISSSVSDAKMSPSSSILQLAPRQNGLFLYVIFVKKSSSSSVTRDEYLTNCPEFFSHAAAKSEVS